MMLRRLFSPASLGAKLVLILTGVGVGGAVAITLLLALVITPSFHQLETHVAGQDVAMLGLRMLLLAVAGTILLLLLVLAVLRRVIARLVLAPLARVETQMQRVSGSGELSPLADEGRRDEIGSLGRSFNAMLGQLADLRGRIEAQSFELGRSESAVAVMHNVRNALNPISTILTQGLAQPPAIDRATIDRALAELAQDVEPDRRRRLAAFVTAAVATQDLARDQVRGQLAVGREAMAQVLEIIGEQQLRTHERPPLAPCDLIDIVTRNAAIARYAPAATIAVAMPAGPSAGPALVMANRVILSQVVGNLLANAAESIAATGRGTGSIAVSIAAQDHRLRLSLRDDGEGFDPAAVAGLFRRGYSTRADKSGGLGLHWCANAMTAMGGALDLISAGPGQGAEAVLTLDLAEPHAVAA